MIDSHGIFRVASDFTAHICRHIEEAQLIPREAVEKRDKLEKTLVSLVDKPHIPWGHFLRTWIITSKSSKWEYLSDHVQNVGVPPTFSALLVKTFLPTPYFPRLEHGVNR